MHVIHRRSFKLLCGKRKPNFIITSLFTGYFLPSMRGVPVRNHVNAVYLLLLFFFVVLLLLEMTEIFYNTSKDDNSTVRPHDDNIECFNSNLNRS